MEDADLIICVLDRSVPLDENDREILRFIKEKKAIVLLNKNDIDPVLTEEDIAAMTETDVISFSAVTGEGMEQLKDKIEHMFLKGDLELNEEICVTSVRHKTALREAAASLKLVLESIENEMPEDFYSIDLMGACEALGQITGESAGEDLVNEIFSRFCMGK